MKRFAVAVLLTITGVALALPGAVGLVAERQHDRLVNQVNGSGGQLVQEHYQRGWFSSQARLRYRIEDEQLRRLAATITAEPAGNTELVVASEIYHGPMPLIAGGSAPLAWTDVDSTLLLRAPSGAEIPLPGELRSAIEADGSSRFSYRAEAETRVLRDGLTLSWNDTAVDVRLTRGHDSLSVAGDIGRISLADDDAAATVGPASIVAEQERSGNGLWTGESSIQIDLLSVPGLSASDLLLETRVRESAQLASYAVDLKADNLQGEHFDGDDAQIAVFAQRLDAGALSGLMALIRDYPDSAAIPVARRDALLDKLLRGGPEITLSTMKLPMPGGDLEGQAFVSVNPGTGYDSRELAQGAAGTATFLVPKTLVERLKADRPEARDAIEIMQRFRVLQPEGHRYRIEAEYDGSLLKINGFPIPLPVF